MTHTFWQPKSALWIMRGMVAVLAVLAVWLAFNQELLFAALLAGVSVMLAAFGLPSMKKPFLVIDQAGLRSPPMLLDIAWSNIREVYLVYPYRDSDQNPTLGFDVIDESQAGVGTYKPKALKDLMSGLGLPRIYLKMPVLEVPLETVLQAIDSVAPGKRAPTRRLSHPTPRDSGD